MSTSNSDNLDIAAELQQRLNDAAEARVRQLAAPERHPDFDGIHCVDCGEKVVKERLKLGKVRCVLCQITLEKRNRK